ncbi:GMC family oxidoreductase N-terminal domain-containing protein [Streptomyces sp. NPDC056534]|uniref:GMC family oxidoreductase n=1 Tax=Streptomyces sp. NPDC056534 TaxID=3345857 RepID=UPI00368F510E
MNLHPLVHAVLGRDPEHPWMAAVPARLETVAAAMPLATRLALRSASAAVDAYAIARTGRRIRFLPTSQLDQLLVPLAGKPLTAALLDAVKMPVLLAAGTEQMLAQRGQSPPMVKHRSDPLLDCVPAKEWPSCSVADAVIIGSGAGGAIAARSLARAGMRVVVLEEGEHHSTSSFARDTPLDRFSKLYRDGGASFAYGRSPVLLPYGRAVGGTTVINSGTCYRTPQHVVQRWKSTYGFELADSLDSCLDVVESDLSVGVQPLDVLGRNGNLALAGAEKLGWQASPLRRNASGCAGSCQCVVGCPTGAKQSMQISVLPEACTAGAKIITRARALRLLVNVDQPGGARAAGVQVSRADGSVLEILAPLIVVAAGALQTPPLLRRSGLGSHPELGRNLSVHPAISVAGRFSEPVRSSKGVLQSVGIEEWHQQGILLEATAAPPGMGSFVLPGAGKDLRRELAESDHLATLGAMIADRPSGRVMGRSRAHVLYSLAPSDGRRLGDALRAAATVLFAAGAEEVLTGIPAAPAVRSASELEDLLDGTTPGQLHLSAFHPTGTVAAGGQPQQAPTDSRGQLRGVRGVLIADGSVLPSCPEVNPQLSIMAAALAITQDWIDRQS